MKKIDIINIKKDNPTVDIAMFYLKEAILENTAMGLEVLKVIHGYGSSGKGGGIKKEARRLLKHYEKTGLVKKVVPGELWNSFKSKELGLDIPELSLNLDGENSNMGMTIVILNQEKVVWDL